MLWMMNLTNGPLNGQFRPYDTDKDGPLPETITEVYPGGEARYAKGDDLGTQTYAPYEDIAYLWVEPQGTGGGEEPIKPGGGIVHPQ